jgi:hypothetical protein
MNLPFGVHMHVINVVGVCQIFDLNAVFCKTSWRPSLQFHDELMQSALVSQKETNKP